MGQWKRITVSVLICQIGTMQPLCVSDTTACYYDYEQGNFCRFVFVANLELPKAFDWEHYLSIDGTNKLLNYYFFSLPLLTASLSRRIFLVYSEWEKINCNVKIILLNNAFAEVCMDSETEDSIHGEVNSIYLITVYFVLNIAVWC